MITISCVHLGTLKRSESSTIFLNLLSFVKSRMNHVSATVVFHIYLADTHHNVNYLYFVHRRLSYRRWGLLTLNFGPVVSFWPELVVQIIN